jgi:hypothetical protein
MVPVPTATEPLHEVDCLHTSAGSAKARMRCAQLLKRVFDIDVKHCRHCGGQLKLIADIEEPAAIARILFHLGLAAQPPPPLWVTEAIRAIADKHSEGRIVSALEGGYNLTALGRSAAAHVGVLVS